MKWFRLYSEIKDDPKMLELDDHQRWLWICLLAMVSEAREARGMLVNVRLRGLAGALRTDVTRLEEALTLFSELEMIEYDSADQTITICHWDERQHDKPSDKAEATRERKYRSRQCHANVTPMSRQIDEDVTLIDIDIDIDTETDTETTNSADAELPVIAPAPATEPAFEPKVTQPQPKTPRLVTSPTAHQAIFGALAEVCVLDPKLKAAHLGKTAKQLAAAGYDAAQVAAFGEWFRCVDWRGQRGSPPTLAQVAELIKQSTTPCVQHPVPQERTNGNGRHYDQRERSSGLSKPPVSAADQAYIDSLPAEWRQ